MWYTVSPLHMNLQVVNFQRCKCVFTCPIMSVQSCSLPSVSYCWRSFSSTISHLLSLLLAVTLLACLLSVSPCVPGAVLSKVLYHNIKNVFFIFLFFMYCLCEKYYKPISVYIADCVSWVPRLTLLDLWTNWTYKYSLGMELVHM